MSLRVFIVKSAYPRDFFVERLDGLAACSFPSLLGTKSELRLALDKAHFKKAVRDHLGHTWIHGVERYR